MYRHLNCEQLTGSRIYQSYKDVPMHNIDQIPAERLSLDMCVIPIEEPKNEGEIEMTPREEAKMIALTRRRLYGVKEEGDEERENDIHVVPINTPTTTTTSTASGGEVEVEKKKKKVTKPKDKNNPNRLMTEEEFEELGLEWPIGGGRRRKAILTPLQILRLEEIRKQAKSNKRAQ